MKISMITLIFFLAVFLADGQNLQLSDINGPIAGGAVILQTGTPDSVLFNTFLNVTNSGSQPMEVLCRKTEVSLLDSTKVFMCWAGVCNSANNFTSSTFQVIGPGMTYTDFKGTYQQVAYQPLGPGESVVRWTFFDRNNPGDSVSVTVIYSTHPVGLEEQQAVRPEMGTPWPNPAGDLIRIPLRLGINCTFTAIVIDMKGVLQAVIKLNPDQKELLIDTGDYLSGQYTILLQANGLSANTKQFMVKQ